MEKYGSDKNIYLIAVNPASLNLTEYAKRSAIAANKCYQQTFDMVKDPTQTNDPYVLYKAKKDGRNQVAYK